MVIFSNQKRRSLLDIDYNQWPSTDIILKNDNNELIKRYKRNNKKIQKQRGKLRYFDNSRKRQRRKKGYKTSKEPSSNNRNNVKKGNGNKFKGNKDKNYKGK